MEATPSQRSVSLGSAQHRPDLVGREGWDPMLNRDIPLPLAGATQSFARSPIIARRSPRPATGFPPSRSAS
eukprot:9477345-Pyramimonas_sp.AAC.1